MEMDETVGGLHVAVWICGCKCKLGESSQFDQNVWLKQEFELWCHHWVFIANGLVTQALQWKQTKNIPNAKSQILGSGIQNSSATKSHEDHHFPS